MTTLSKCLRRLRARLKSDWREEDHPRAEDGRFGDKPGEHGGAGGGKRRRVVRRTEDTTHEGVPRDRAGDLTPDEAREAIAFADGMTLLAGNNKPNPGLPDGTRPALDEYEAGALQKYSFKNDGPLNAWLRKGECCSGSPYNRTYFEELHGQLQAAFAKAPVLDRPVRVVRGMQLDAGTLEQFAQNILDAGHSGAPVSFNGYTSTARPSGVLAKLGLASGIPGPFRGNVSLTINAVHGLDVKPYSQLPGEGEMLLPHGARFRVRSATRTKNGDLFVELDQLPPAVVAKAMAERFKGEGEDAPEDLARFYEDNPEAAGKWLDRDTEHIIFGRGGGEKALAPLLYRLRARLKATDAAGHEHKPPGPGGGQFTGHGGGGGGGSGRDRPQSRREAYEQARAEWRAAADAAHEHAKGADDLQAELADAFWGHPAVHKLEDALIEASKHTNEGRVWEDGRERPSMLPPTDKLLVHRHDDYRRVAGAAGRAILAYARTPRFEDGREEADRGKVQAVLRKALLWGQKGLEKIEAVKEARRKIEDLRGDKKALAPLLCRLRARLKAEDAAGHEHRPPGPGGGQFTGHGEGGGGGAGQAGGTEEDSGKEDMPMRKLSRGELAIVREAGLSGQEEYDAASGLLHEALRVGRADLKKPAILLWHGTSLENAKRVAANPKLRAGQRGLNASADISHAAQYPEDTGADALVLLRAKTDELDVDPNDQEGETVEEGLFPKSGYGSSCTLGGHQILAVIDMRSGVNRKEAFEALEGGDLYNALEHGATVLYFAEAEDES